MISERKLVLKKNQKMAGNHFFNEVFNVIQGLRIRMKILKIQKKCESVALQIVSSYFYQGHYTSSNS